MENINIAVIGAAGVGKSTLIQRALGLRSLPTAVIRHNDRQSKKRILEERR